MTMPGHQRLLEELGDDLADHFLEQEAADAGAGVDGGQDEHRFEHDGEVVPVGHQPLHEGHRREDVGHAHGERYRAARTALDLFADLFGQVRAGSTRSCRAFAKTAGAVLMAK